MKKGLITLLAGYAAGLAMALKYRRDHKPSAPVEDTPTPETKSKVDEFIDDVVDIHKTAYEDIKSVVAVTFEEVKDFDELKTKVNEFVSTFKSEFDEKVASITAEGTAKFDQIQKTLEEFYARKQELLKNAGEKARSLSNISQDAIDLLLGEARKHLAESYDKIKAELNNK